MRICLDSNALVAAFASRGLCADLLRLTLSDYDLVIPAVVVEEVRRVLAKKLKLPPSALSAAEAVIERCEIIPTGSTPSPISVPDPDDELVLAGALAGNAQILISGDADLLSVAAQSPIPILSPQAFLTLTRRGSSL